MKVVCITKLGALFCSYKLSLYCISWLLVEVCSVVIMGSVLVALIEPTPLWERPL